MAELNTGDRVALLVPEALTSDGGMVFIGQIGVVIGGRGEQEVIVSWGTTPPYRAGSVQRSDLVRIVTGRIQR